MGALTTQGERFSGARGTARQAPTHARVVTVEARHAVQNQAPRELARAIRAWADDHGLLHPDEKPSQDGSARR